MTYEIIDKIHNLGFGFQDEHFNISSLFYMDDGLIFAENIHKLSQLIFRIENICFKYGLQLNKSKCKILSFNAKEKLEYCSGIEIVQKSNQNQNQNQNFY